MDITGLPALVTGGGSGLGAATARRLAADGAKVGVVDLTAEIANAVAEEIGGLALEADVRDARALEAAFAAAQEAHGPLRILVNCAGVGPSKKIWSARSGAMPLEDFTRVVDINLNGTFNGLRLAAAEMAAAEPLDEDGARGVIINTASIAGYEGQIGQAAYGASKAGVIGLTLPAARELGRHGIRVVTIAPGVFHTPMFETVAPEWRQSITEAIPWPRRAGMPEEFAAMVRFIIGNPLINGATLRLDGANRLG